MKGNNKTENFISQMKHLLIKAVISGHAKKRQYHIALGNITFLLVILMINKVIFIALERISQIFSKKKQIFYYLFTFMILICLLSACLEFVPVTLQEQGKMYPDIYSALLKINVDFNRKIDVNKDGLINCIDAAVLFYKYYPNKNNVQIVLNRNSLTGMNHLFNCVKINGIWTSIEPQAYHSRKNSFWMKDVWGKTYDSSKDKVVTSDYLMYVK